MRRSLLHNLVADPAAAHGPALLGVGLAILIVAMLWPGLPAVTAMALVALGATGVTGARFRTAAALLPTLLLHLAVYTALYALFVGATLHAAATQEGGGLSATQGFDLAISIWPMVLTWRIAISAMLRGAGGEDAPAR